MRGGFAMPVDPCIQIIHSVEATILSVLAMISAVVLLIRKFKELVSGLRSSMSSIINIFPLRGGTPMVLQHKWLQILFILLLTIPIALLVARAAEPIPPNVRMMNDVWKAFNNAEQSKDKESYLKAIKAAEKLIKKFEPGAKHKQKMLLEEKVEIQKPGNRSQEKKKIIWEFGPLHEISASWWVIGRSREERKELKEAIEAYEKAAKYLHALVYDPTWDGFWSPSDESKARIDNLKEKK